MSKQAVDLDPPFDPEAASAFPAVHRRQRRPAEVRRIELRRV